NLPRVLPPEDSPAGVFLTRVRCLREWLPELGLPALDEAELRELVTWLCHGCRSFEELRRAGWLGVLQGRLTPRPRQAVPPGGPGGGAGAAGGAQRQPAATPLRGRPAAGAGRAHPGAVRPARHAPGRGRPGPRPAAPARPQPPAAAGHRRPRQLLGQYLPANT